MRANTDNKPLATVAFICIFRNDIITVAVRSQTLRDCRRVSRSVQRVLARAAAAREARTREVQADMDEAIAAAAQRRQAVLDARRR